MFPGTVMQIVFRHNKKSVSSLNLLSSKPSLHMDLLEKTVLNMVNCGGQCYSMSNQELNFWITYSVVFCNLLSLQVKSKHDKQLRTQLFKIIFIKIHQQNVVGFLLPTRTFLWVPLPPWHEETCPQREDEWPAKSARCAEFHPETPRADLPPSSDLPAEL